MSFNWSEYLSIAEQLCGMPVTGPPAGAEAQQRAAVSRAYYAAFVSARNRMRDVDRIPIPVGGAAHTFVANLLEQDPDPRRTQIGIQLRRLRIARNTCDYDDIVVTNVPTLAQRSLTRAAQVLADLGSL